MAAHGKAAKEEFSPISGQIKLLPCRGNRPLAEKIAKCLDMELSNVSTVAFGDGEIYTQIRQTIRGADIYIIQTTGLTHATDDKTGEQVIHSVNDMVMELLIMVDGARRASAGTINVVIPYFGYARQDRKVVARDPISAKIMANIIEKTGADRVITMDLHSPQIQGFFDIPVDHLQGLGVFVEYYKEKFKGEFSDFAVVSPDVGSASKSRKLANRLGVPLVILEKQRTSHDESQVVSVIGDPKGKKVIIFDDLISTGTSIANAAKAIIEKGATEVYACTVHALLTGNGVSRIEDSPIKELAVLDTVVLPKEKHISKINQLSAAPVFAEAIKRIHNGESVSEMF